MRPSWKSVLFPALLLAACANPSADDASAADSVDSSPSATGTQQPDDGLQMSDAQQRIDVQSQKAQIMAQSYVDMGDEAFERGDYVTAARHYGDAARMDPNNNQAADGLRRSQAAASGQAWDYSPSNEVQAQNQARDQARYARILGLVNDGDRAMSAGDYGAAVQAYQAAATALENAPLQSTGALDLGAVEAKLAGAVEARNESATAQRSADAQAADAAAAEEKARQAEYRENQIATLLAEADDLYQRGYPADSIDKLDYVLRLDPRNEDALRLRRIAVNAAHHDREKYNAEHNSNEWNKAFEELRTLAVPPARSYAYDVAHWDAIADRQPLDRVDAADKEDPVAQSIAAALEQTRLVPRFDNSVEEIADNLAAYTNVNFVISRAVREDVDEDVKQIRLEVKNEMPVARVLDIMEDLMGGEVKFVIRYGAVMVVTAEEAQTDTLTLQYEVRDIVRPLKDFVLPETNLSPSGGIDYEEEELPESEAAILTEDELIETIQENIDPDSWDGDTRSATIENGTLIIHHTREVHQQIADLLEGMREPANIMVEIKVRFLRVEDSFLQDIGVDFRGLGDDSTQGVPGKGTNSVFDDFGNSSIYGSPGSPGVLGTGQDTGFNFREAGDNVNILGRSENLYDSRLGDSETLDNSGGFAAQYTWLDDSEVEMILRAVQKSKRSELVIEPKLMVSNTARANLVVANQVSYVADFDVEIASSAAIADPIVRVATDGIFLDVRPVVTADRRFVWVDVRPTVATLRRPIPTLQTSLGTGSPVTLMLPELELQKIRTRAFVPDGGSLLLGGMKMVEEQEMDSGIPYLKDVPVLSFFFSRKGSYETYQKLVILLTANIILPEELEPAPLPAGF